MLHVEELKREERLLELLSELGAVIACKRLRGEEADRAAHALDVELAQIDELDSFRRVAEEPLYDVADQELTRLCPSREPLRDVDDLSAELSTALADLPGVNRGCDPTDSPVPGTDCGPHGQSGADGFRRRVEDAAPPVTVQGDLLAAVLGYCTVGFRSDVVEGDVSGVSGCSRSTVTHIDDEHDCETPCHQTAGRLRSIEITDASQIESGSAFVVRSRL